MYKATIGLEFHIEVIAKSKAFATSSTDFGADTNINIDEITMAYPGTLPSLNREVVIKAIQSSHLFNMEIDDVLRFDRKCYFYSDNPKNYQITQFHYPIGKKGNIKIKDKNIEIERIHIEEDTAKQIYNNNKILINYNRAGNPLIEMVTAPVINSADEAYECVSAIRDMLLYSEISDARMEQGSLRCDVNISISKTSQLGTKIEIKNLNSISNVRDAINYEIKRQTKLLNDGKELIEETRRWSEGSKSTIFMRRKHDNADYIYLPDPNIPPMYISKKFIKNAIMKMPKSLLEIKTELELLKLEDNQIEVLLKSRELTTVFLGLSSDIDSKRLVNFLISDISAYINKNSISANKLNKKSIVTLFNKIDDKTISTKQAKEFIQYLFSDNDINKIIKVSGKIQISNAEQIRKILLLIKDENIELLKDIKNRPKRVEKHFIGQLMKKTKGQANPQIAMGILKEMLKKWEKS